MKKSASQKSKPKFYNLVEFPYPSGNLHMGHWYAFAVPDIFARYKQMQGYDVMYPMGFDAFGLPAENAAIQRGVQPADWTRDNIAHMTKQMKSMGTMFDWSRTVSTIDPDYYRWTQWIFLQFYKAGLAYRAKTMVNWCPKDKTVLANEQVVDGKCDRCDAVVEQREREQWMYRITKYADALLEGLEKVDWPEVTKTAQRNWIGKSEGAIIKFDDIDVFTTRPDTILSATFVAIPSNGNGEKFIDKYVTNPATQEKIPVWTADYVLDSYGTGAIMGVPAYDERDEAFAKKHDLAIKQAPPFNVKGGGEGILKPTTKYRLHDWILSRQRYWGTPIPMIVCKDCGYIPVKEEELPVKLPQLDNYLPADDGSSPLARAEEWVKTECPKCGGEALRETDTMDTFVDSSWYFLRYPSVASATSGQAAWDPEMTKKWLPVDLYTGGAEHNTMHLLYSRFFIKALHELGYVDFDEPFTVRRNHGTVLGPDGQKMSKSKGNVIDPDKEVEQYGADAVRMYLAFLGPYDTFNGPWDPRGIVGIDRFLKRVLKLVENVNIKNQNDNVKLQKILHKAIKKIGDDIEVLHFNTAVSELMKLLNEFEKFQVSSSMLQDFMRLLAPFAPHLTAELWKQNPFWPQFDPELIVESTANFVIQIDGKTRGVITLPVDSDQSTVISAAEKDESIKRHITAPIQKTIFVKAKLLNILLRHT